MPQLPPPCLEAALRYLARGWSAIALCPPDHKGVSGEHETLCKSPGKAPLWSWKAYQERLPRESELKLFWQRCPSSNVGVVMGPVSGLIGLDIDSQAGIDLLDSICGGVPDTFNFSTPGGQDHRRLFFKWPSVEIQTRSIKVNGKEALRVQAAGAQTVMPPSIHPCGVAYGLEWEDKPLLDLPKALIEYLQKPSHPQLAAEASVPVYERAKAYLAKCDPCVSGSGGHDKAMWVACKMIHGFGLTPEAALQLLLEDYNPRCLPPWTRKEWEHKLQEAVTKGTAASLLEKANDAKKKALLPFPTKAEPEPLIPQEEHFHLIERRPVEWLVPGWIPLGKLTVLDGDPGLGKSTLLLDIAARVSSHGMGFNGRQGPAGHVILLSAEDSSDDTIQPRLTAAGANLERITSIKSIKQGELDRPVEIPADLPIIDAMIAKYGAKLLVIEPLAAYLAGPDANKDQEIRRVLYKLSRIAERHNCAAVTMRHLNKHSGGKAIYRGNMSIGVIGHARVGLIVGEDPDDDSKRVLAMAKINCGPRQDSMKFALVPVPELDVCRVEWLGVSPYSGDQLVSQPASEESKEKQEYEASKRQQCMELLKVLLSEGKKPVKQLKDELLSATFSTATINRAQQDLGITLSYEMINETRVYFWELPSAIPG